MPLKLLEQLIHHGTTRGDAIAYIAPNGESMSYRQLLASVGATAELLRESTPRDAVVIASGRNEANYAAAFLTVLAAGRRLMAVSAELTDSEIISVTEQTGACAFIAGCKAHASIEHSGLTIYILDDLVQPGEIKDNFASESDASQLLLQSSGTTSRPKIVQRSGPSLDIVGINTANHVGFRDDDTVLAVVPLSHSYGMEHGILAPVIAGSTVQLCNGMDLATISDLLSNISILPGVPVIYEALARSDSPLPIPRIAYSAGAPMPIEVNQSLSDRGLHIGQLYGATEIGSVTYQPARDQPLSPGDIGPGFDGVDIRILDINEPSIESPLPTGEVGQVAIRATSMMDRYLDDDTSSLIDGFFLTGDLGKIDEHGALQLTGRLKLLIDVGGRKVNPLEIEDVLMQHPAVDQCVVVGVPVLKTVCRIKAVVVASADVSTTDLQQFAKQRLAPYKTPRQFEIRDSLPRTSAGKVARQAQELLT